MDRFRSSECDFPFCVCASMSHFLQIAKLVNHRNCKFLVWFNSNIIDTGARLSSFQCDFQFRASLCDPLFAILVVVGSNSKE